LPSDYEFVQLFSRWPNVRLPDEQKRSYRLFARLSVPGL
jgi:hypothetical protein